MSSNPKEGFWWKLVHLEPVIYKSLVLAVASLLTSFGVVIAEDVPNSLVVLIGAVFALIQGVWTRESVMPTEKVVVYQPYPATRPATVAAGMATTLASAEEIVDAARAQGSPKGIN